MPALKGEDKEVINSFKKVINIDPGYAEAYYRIGLVYGKLQEGENAITKILIAENFTGDRMIKKWLLMRVKKFGYS